MVPGLKAVSYLYIKNNQAVKNTFQLWLRFLCLRNLLVAGFVARLVLEAWKVLPLAILRHQHVTVPEACRCRAEPCKSMCCLCLTGHQFDIHRFLSVPNHGILGRVLFWLLMNEAVQ